MAGIDVIPSIPTQVQLVARLRWQLFRNSLSTWRGRMEAVSLVILGLTLGSFAVGGGVGLAVFAFFCVQTGRPGWLALPLWFVFIFWQLLPVFVFASTPQPDFSNLLRFPLRFSSFFLLSLVYGLYDPFALTACFWLVSIAFGAALANPGMLAQMLGVLAIFILVNLFLSRAISAWLNRWLARRRTRELLGAILLLGMMGAQLAGAGANRLFTRGVASRSRGAPPLVLDLLALEQAAPPGLVAQALAATGSGHRHAARCVALLTAYTLAFAGLLSIRLRAQYRGEDLREDQPRRVIPVKGKLLTAWRLPALSPPLGALLEKELRYLARNGPMLFALAAPFVLLLSLRLSTARSFRFSRILITRPDMTFPLGAMLVLLGLMNLAFNSLAFEGRGLQLLLAAPIRLRDLFLAKNLMQLLVAALQMLAVWLVAAFASGPPGVIVCIATFSALLFILPVNFAVGNLISVYFPLRLEFGLYRHRANSGVGALVGFGVQLCLIAVAAANILLARFYGILRVTVPIFLILAVLATWGYVRVLNFCERAAMEHREALVMELCR